MGSSQGLVPDGSPSAIERLMRDAGTAAAYFRRRKMVQVLSDARTLLTESPRGSLAVAAALGFVLGSSLRSRR
jgi:ElaB/YqjD/DUF883 family membrane-anchored ribosome-binding protein